MLKPVKLSPDEVSLAFLYLSGTQPGRLLPPRLKQLTLVDWQQLAYLLEMLEQERELHPLH
jgi:hypothetical protein